MSNVIVGDNLIAAITGGALYLTPLARTTPGTAELEMAPAAIMAAYVINELDKMTDPDDRDDWPMYISHMPDGKNVKTNCGAVYDTPGVNDPRPMIGVVNPHQGIQIRIRSNDYEIGYAKIEDIAIALDIVVNDSITIGLEEYEVQNVSRASPIVSLGIEPGTKRRFHFTVNYLLTVRKLT